MKTVYALALLVAVTGALAQDIYFTNSVATFTNLGGRVYSKVKLVKADLDGLIWRDDKGGGGRVCYTNLDAAFLAQQGIPEERIAIAKARAEHKAVSDRQYQTAVAAQANSAAHQQAAAQAAFTASAPDRKRAAQEQADWNAIVALRAQIKQTEDNLRHQQALAHEATMANPGSYYVVGEALIKENIDKAKKRLSQMEGDYQRKYSK